MAFPIAQKIFIDEELKKLREATAELPRDSIVTYHEIESLVKLNRNVEGDKAAWSKLIRHWKRLMLGERQIHVNVERNVGYRLCDYAEHMECAKNIAALGLKKIRQAKLVSGIVDPAALNELGQKFQASLNAVCESTETAYRVEFAKHKSVLSKTNALPKLGVNGSK